MDPSQLPRQFLTLPTAQATNALTNKLLPPRHPLKASSRPSPFASTLRPVADRDRLDGSSGSDIPVDSKGSSGLFPEKLCRDRQLHVGCGGGIWN